MENVMGKKEDSVVISSYEAIAIALTDMTLKTYMDFEDIKSGKLSNRTAINTTKAKYANLKMIDMALANNPHRDTEIPIKNGELNFKEHCFIYDEDAQLDKPSYNRRLKSVKIKK